jgi:hypothetical protein
MTTEFEAGRMRTMAERVAETVVVPAKSNFMVISWWKFLGSEVGQFNEDHCAAIPATQ